MYANILYKPKDFVANIYCCKSLNQLKNNGYVYNGLIYFQKLDVETNFPADLRFYNFCITCGVPANDNHDKVNAECIAFKDGIFKRRLGPLRIDKNAKENQYTFNLDKHDKILTVSVGHPHYPEPTRLQFCPYCGSPVG